MRFQEKNILRFTDLYYEVIGMTISELKSAKYPNFLGPNVLKKTS